MTDWSPIFEDEDYVDPDEDSESDDGAMKEDRAEDQEEFWDGF